MDNITAAQFVLLPSSVSRSCSVTAISRPGVRRIQSLVKKHLERSSNPPCSLGQLAPCTHSFTLRGSEHSQSSYLHVFGGGRKNKELEGNPERHGKNMPKPAQVATNQDRTRDPRTMRWHHNIIGCFCDFFFFNKLINL